MKNNICTSITRQLIMSADGTTIMLAALASVLVLYVVQQERKSSPTSLGSKSKPKATLGTSKASLGKSLDCSNVSLDSPDFARCSTTLGAGRTVVRGKPRADNVNRSFLKDEFNLGNPFAVKIDDQFTKDTNSKLGSTGGQAFPFSQVGSESSSFGTGSLGAAKLNPRTKDARGQLFKNVYGKLPPMEKKSVEAPSRGSARSSLTLGASEFASNPTLGAAVSPSSLGASSVDIANATNKLGEIDTVSSNTGGNLNLLHPL